jgi:hypothetical protein
LTGCRAHRPVSAADDYHLDAALYGTPDVPAEIFVIVDHVRMRQLDAALDEHGSGLRKRLGRQPCPAIGNENCGSHRHLFPQLRSG